MKTQFGIPQLSQKKLLAKIVLLFSILSILSPGFVKGQNCGPLLPNAVSWWSAENDANDKIGGNNGTLVGVSFYTTGEVGQGFTFDGNQYSGVQLGACSNLQLQDFTIEAWVQRADLSACSHSAGGPGELFCFGAGGYSFYLDASGHPALSKTTISAVVSSGSGISDFGFHHVAVAKSGSNVVFYLDGVAAPVATYNQIFTFGTDAVAGLGTQGDNLNNCFWGTIDELTIYNGPLSSADIQAIYNAGPSGKCTSLVVVAAPPDQTAYVGTNITFSADVGGLPPITYQWQFNGTNIDGATNSTLSLINVQTVNSGTYTFIATNNDGSVSASGNLNVVPLPPCIPPSPQIVSWWAAEGNGLDQISTNNGALLGNTTFDFGEVGHAFVFDGTRGTAVQLGKCPNLQLQDFTLEAWIRRSSLTTSSSNPSGSGELFCYGGNGYCVFLDSEGHLALGQTDVATVFSSGPTVNDLNFHHVAVTKSGASVVFYLDGSAISSSTFSNVFTFSAQAAIGAKGDDLTFPFLGAIDELSIYNGALDPSAIQLIYGIGISGKCQPPVPPFFVSQPETNTTAFVGGSATYSVLVGGATPIAYQWQFNGADIPGATTSSLALSGLQLTNSGSYQVIARNDYGSLTNTPTYLAVVVAPPCIAPPAGLVSWWSAESNALDEVSANNGTPVGSSYLPGEVGTSFFFNGNGQAVRVGNPVNLQLQNFTIEAWIRRASASNISKTLSGRAFFFAYGTGGYGFGINASNQLILNQVGGTAITLSNITIADTNFHYVAVTKSGSNVFFYVDGSSYSSIPFSQIFNFSTMAAIGAQGDTLNSSFWGAIDELSIYDRPLSPVEIQSIHDAFVTGKCHSLVIPTIATQPRDLTAQPTASVTFTAAAAGSTPLFYQWRLNDANLPGATNSSLTLSNVQSGNTGNYSLLVSNAAGFALSSNAFLNVSLVTVLGNGIPLTNSVYNFNGSATVEMQNYYTNGYIFFTLDGTTPTAGSTLYTSPFVINQNTVIRTLGYSPDFSQFTLSRPITLQIIPFYTLDASTPGGGTISVNPSGGSYVSNSIVTITAIPSNGWAFLQWVGDAAGGNPSNTIVMDQNKSVQAIFGTTLSNNAVGGGSVIVNPPGKFYPYGTILQLSGLPQQGNAFVLWGSSASGNINPLSFKVTNANPSISALFTTTSSGQASLTVVPLGHGKVSVSPQANIYAVNAAVSITAIPDATQTFVGWSGDATGNQNPLTISMNTNKVIYANFSTNNRLDGHLGSGGFSDGFQLDLNGELGLQYRLDASSNLMNWTPLFTVTNWVGTLHYTDTNAGNFSNRFYRFEVIP